LTGARPAIERPLVTGWGRSIPALAAAHQRSKAKVTLPQLRFLAGDDPVLAHDVRRVGDHSRHDV
jgi:hypothetical protein